MYITCYIIVTCYIIIPPYTYHATEDSLQMKIFRINLNKHDQGQGQKTSTALSQCRTGGAKKEQAVDSKVL